VVQLPDWYDEAPTVPYAVEQGTRFEDRIISYADQAQTILADWTGWTGELVVAKWAGGPQIGLFTHATPPSQGRIVLGGTAGWVDIDIPGDVTAGWPAGDWIYDLTLFEAGDPAKGLRLVKGPLRVVPRARA
jgi:hypothetical protein